MIVVHLFLTLLNVAFFVGLAIACIGFPVLTFKAFRARSKRPRPLSREERERARHDAFMASERERLDRLA
jgi:hypothetical protein